MLLYQSYLLVPKQQFQQLITEGDHGGNVSLILQAISTQNVSVCQLSLSLSLPPCSLPLFSLPPLSLFLPHPSPLWLTLSSPISLPLSFPPSLLSHTNDLNGGFTWRELIGHKEHSHCQRSEGTVPTQNKGRECVGLEKEGGLYLWIRSAKHWGEAAAWKCCFLRRAEPSGAGIQTWMMLVFWAPSCWLAETEGSSSQN